MLRPNLLLCSLGEAEDVVQAEALLGDGQAGVLIEPGEFALAQNTPFTLNGN